MLGARRIPHYYRESSQQHRKQHRARFQGENLGNLQFIELLNALVRRLEDQTRVP